MLCVSLEHIEEFLVIFSETSETGHVAFPENWLIWHGMTRRGISRFKMAASISKQHKFRDFLPKSLLHVKHCVKKYLFMQWLAFVSLQHHVAVCHVVIIYPCRLHNNDLWSTKCAPCPQCYQKGDESAWPPYVCNCIWGHLEIVNQTCLTNY